MSFDFEMGRYGLYVWGAYAASAAVLAAVVADTLRRAAKWRREAERRAPPR
ncbi:MAG TPA: heme exporter protein CcmD [Caulobacteraceae bacterium]